MILVQVDKYVGPAVCRDTENDVWFYQSCDTAVFGTLDSALSWFKNSYSDWKKCEAPGSKGLIAVTQLTNCTKHEVHFFRMKEIKVEKKN